MPSTYSDDCLEIVSALRKRIVFNLAKRVRGYIHVVFTNDGDMIVELLDPNNEVLHKEIVKDVISQATKYFSTNEFCNMFIKNFRKNLNKKYFKNPLDNNR